jgi:translation initiation factor 1 (eIF-1/SUI1)
MRTKPMARTCTICSHPAHRDIDRDLITSISIPDIAAKYCVSIDALGRHKANHLSKTLAKAQEAKDRASSDNLLERLDSLSDEAHRIRRQAERAGDYKTALGGIRELVRIVELLAKLRGELAQEGTVNILVTAEWQSLRGAVLDALQPFPDARLALAERLKQYDADN